jgi:hypothetical protein
MTIATSTADPSLTESLLRLELQLMDPVFRRDHSKVAALLADEFREFGSSGRVWNRATVLELMDTERDFMPPAVEEFAVQRIGSDTALATYRAMRPRGATLRSSLWVMDADRWKMLFHQGTKMPDEKP